MQTPGFSVGGMEAPTFVDSPVDIPGVRAEYWISRTGVVQFHLWPKPRFPQQLGQALATTYQKPGVPYKARFDYVGDVPMLGKIDSWFLEISDLTLHPTPMLVNSLLGKLRDTLRTL